MKAKVKPNYSQQLFCLMMCLVASEEVWWRCVTLLLFVFVVVASIKEFHCRCEECMSAERWTRIFLLSFNVGSCRYMTDFETVSTKSIVKDTLFELSFGFKKKKTYDNITEKTVHKSTMSQLTQCLYLTLFIHCAHS